MTFPRLVTPDAESQYWAVVRDCLREFHGMAAPLARRKVAALRKKLDELPGNRESFFHAEPFDVAGDIARNRLKIGNHLERYLHIRDVKHGNGLLTQVLRRPVKT
jgi:hypothetical protein